MPSSQVLERRWEDACRGAVQTSNNYVCVADLQERERLNSRHNVRCSVL